MRKGASTAIILVIALVAVVGIGALYLQQPAVKSDKDMQEQPTHREQEEVPQETSIPDTPHQEAPLPTPYKPINERIFFEKYNVQFEHYWPNSGSLGSDESEILVYNERSQPVQIISTDMAFVADGILYNQYSGTWEKFPSRTSWDRIEYVNIKPNYYKGEPLILQPNQKGKIHYHYQFNGDIMQQQQSVKITIAFKYGEKLENIDMELKRTEYTASITPGASHE